MPLPEPTPERNGLEWLRRSGELGPATFMAFQWMWRQLGGRAGRLRVSARVLAAEFGRDPSAARQWIERLAAHGHVFIVDRDPSAGIYELDVYDPNQTIRSRPLKPDPQGRLPGCEEEAPIEQTEPPGAIVPMQQRGSEVLSSKPPEGSEVLGPKPPEVLNRKPPTPATESEGETPRAREPESGQKTARPDFAANGEPGGETPPLVPKIPKKRTHTSYQSTKEQLDTNGTKEGAPEVLNRKPPTPLSESEGETPRARDEGPIHGPVYVQQAMAEALHQFGQTASPPATRRHLIAEITRHVPDVDRWFTKYLASQVLAGDIEPADLERIYEDIRQLREAEARGGRGCESPAGFLRSKLRKLPGWREPTRRKPR